MSTKDTYNKLKMLGYDVIDVNGVIAYIGKNGQLGKIKLVTNGGVKIETKNVYDKVTIKERQKDKICDNVIFTLLGSTIERKNGVNTYKSTVIAFIDEYGNLYFKEEKRFKVLETTKWVVLADENKVYLFNKESNKKLIIDMPNDFKLVSFGSFDEELVPMKILGDVLFVENYTILGLDSNSIMIRADFIRDAGKYIIVAVKVKDDPSNITIHGIRGKLAEVSCRAFGNRLKVVELAINKSNNEVYENIGERMSIHNTNTELLFRNLIPKEERKIQILK